MKYFDSHVHFFPDALAGKALPRLSGICNCPYYSDGTRAGTLQKLEEWSCNGAIENPIVGVMENAIVGVMGLHIATNAKQQTSVNNFAAESQHGNIWCFGSVFPYADNALEELRRIRELGLYGVKLHPDYQEFFIGDDAALPIYAEAEKLGLPIAFHTGRDPYSPILVHCPPDVLAKIADLFPRLTIIAAHMGGMDMPGESAKYLAGKPNVYFDTAFASHFLDAAQFTELVRLHGADKVLFATDCPWSTAPAEQALLEASGLTESEKEQIAWRNSADLFGIPI